MKKLIKVLKTTGIIVAILFVASLIVYFFNLDMKLAAQLQKIMDKIYDMRKRERRL